MAWNGRNESILGAKPTSPVAAPTPKQAIDSGSNNDPTLASKAKATTTTTSTAGAPQPPKNAWNGKNAKIMQVSDDNNNSSKEKVVSMVIPSNTTEVITMAVISKKPEVVVNTTSSFPSSSSHINHNKKDDDIKPLSKEDETTSSTAGSSTSNTTVDDDPSTNTPPALLEGNVVTTTVTVTAITNTNTTISPSSSTLINNDSEKDDSNDKRTSSLSSSADVKLPRSNSANTTNSNNRQQAHQGRNATFGDHTHHFRRGNNRGGSSSSSRGNGSTKNTNHQSSGKNTNNSISTASRGNTNSIGGSRRRANKSGLPVCSFFLQGLCTRGTSCNFRHDLTAEAQHIAPVNTTSAVSPGSSNNIQDRIESSDRSSSHHQPAVIRSNQFMNAMATSFVPNKRVFDPYKARAIQLAKDAQDAEDRSSFASSFTAKKISNEVEGISAISEEKKTEEIEDPPFVSIDVECVATGYGSCARGINDGCDNEGRNKEGVPPFQFNDRSHRYPGRVAMLDSDGNVLADIIIRPPKDGAGVLSYLTPLTGLTAEICLGEDAILLEEAVDIVKAALPKNGVIVGQAVDHDVEWLGLTAGKDFGRTVDISEIFRQRMPCILNEAVNAIKEKEEDGEATTDGFEEDKSLDKYLGFATRYRHFSLRHVCLNLLGEDIQSGIHDPIIDAKYSLLLFHKYRNSSVTQLRIVRDGLHRAPITPGFAAEKTPVIEGVCVSRAGYPYKRAARKIWRWFSAARGT